MFLIRRGLTVAWLTTTIPRSKVDTCSRQALGEYACSATITGGSFSTRTVNDEWLSARCPGGHVYLTLATN